MTVIMPSGGDDSAAINAAISTDCSIVLGAGRFHLDSAALSLPRSASGIRITGSGRGVTAVQLSSAVTKMFVFDKVADYDSFQNIELADFTLDAANVHGSGVGQTYALLGTWDTVNYLGGYQTRLNLSGIDVHDVDVVNLYTDTTAGEDGPYKRWGVLLASAHLASNEPTQTTITDVRFERVRVIGGNVGIGVSGTAEDSAMSANVLLDRITYEDCYHDTLNTPTEYYAATNFFIGSEAMVGTCRVRNCYGFNAGDDGIEIDCAQDAVVEGCVIQDAWNQGYLAQNFHIPPDLDAQKYTFRDCAARVINGNFTRSGGGLGIPFSGSLYGVTAAQTIGHLLIEDCSYYSEAPDLSFMGEGVVVDYQARVKRVTVRGFRHVHTNINNADTAISPQTPNAVCFRGQGPAQVDISDVHAHFDGVVPSPTTQPGAVLVTNTMSGAPISFNIENVALETTLTGTGISAGATRTVRPGYIGGGWSPPGPITGRIRGVQYFAASGADTDPTGVAVDETDSGITITGGVLISDCDFTRAPGTNASEITIGGSHSNVYSGAILHKDGTVKTALSNTIP